MLIKHLSNRNSAAYEENRLVNIRKGHIKANSTSQLTVTRPVTVSNSSGAIVARTHSPLFPSHMFVGNGIKDTMKEAESIIGSRPCAKAASDASTLRIFPSASAERQESCNKIPTMPTAQLAAGAAYRTPHLPKVAQRSTNNSKCSTAHPSSPVV